MKPITQNYTFDIMYHIKQENFNAFTKKVILIAGAGTGFGQALAIAFLAANAKVILLSRNINKLKHTIELATKQIPHSIDYELFSCDITNTSDLENLQINIKENIDILINCVGLPAQNNALLTQVSPSRWEEMIQTNLKASLFLMRTILPLMKKEIRILNFTSGAAWADTYGYGLYNICKAGLNSLTVSFAKELEEIYKDKIVSVNAINPGEAKSEMNTASNMSPFIVCDMVFKILNTQINIPNGHFFHRDGYPIRFCDKKEFNKELI